MVNEVGGFLWTVGSLGLLNRHGTVTPGYAAGEQWLQSRAYAEGHEGLGFMNFLGVFVETVVVASRGNGDQ